jgi:hypothetical protein
MQLMKSAFLLAAMVSAALALPADAEVAKTEVKQG